MVKTLVHRVALSLLARTRSSQPTLVSDDLPLPYSISVYVTYLNERDEWAEPWELLPTSDVISDAIVTPVPGSQTGDILVVFNRISSEGLTRATGLTAFQLLMSTSWFSTG